MGPLDKLRNAAKEGYTLAFNQCAVLLRSEGHAVPGNLSEAIQLCASKGLIDDMTKQLMHSIRKTSNVAGHHF